MKHDLLTKGFSLSPLLTVEYSSGYLLFILYLMIFFWIDLVCMLAITRNTYAVGGYTHV